MCEPTTAWHIHRNKRAIRLTYEPYCNPGYTSKFSLISKAHGTWKGDSLPAYHEHTKIDTAYPHFKEKERNSKSADEPAWLARQRRKNPYRGGPSVGGLNEFAYHAYNELRDLERRWLP